MGVLLLLHPALQLRLPRWPGLLAAALPQATGEVDELVLARARQGDQDAFATIVGHYDHRLRAVAFRLLCDRDRMEDAALGTWLYRITSRAALGEPVRDDRR